MLRVNYRSLGRPLEDSPVLRQVIGVAGDVRQRGLEAPSNMAVYLPYRQDSTRRSLRSMVLFARTAGDPDGMARSIHADVRALSRDVPVQSVRSLHAIVQDTEAPRVFTLVLLCAFAAIALLLAAIGLYGVIAYSVSRRVREIGIRMALGANKGDILTSVFRHEGRWLLGGVAAGVVGAASLSRLIAGMLFGVAPGDPVTFAGVLGVLALVAVAACWAPARRAVRLDPVLALRNE
jgi:putative ABC transport system permease protein